MASVTGYNNNKKKKKREMRM